MLIAIRLVAGHTTSGNPRRVYVLLDQHGVVVDAVDEGYQGHGALKVAGYPPESVVMGPDFETTPAQYRELLKFSKEVGS